MQNSRRYVCVNVTFVNKIDSGTLKCSGTKFNEPSQSTKTNIGVFLTNFKMFRNVMFTMP